MNATGFAHAQQAIGLRPSLDENTGTADLPATSRDISENLDLSPPPPPDGGSAQAVPPPGGQPEISAPSIDPYDPLGLRVGSFRAYPSVEVTGVVTDNIQQSASTRQSDIGLRVAPELRLQSDWVRHAYSLTASGEAVFYADHTDFDEYSANVTGNLVLDVRRSTAWETTSSYELSQTSPSSSEVPNSASGRRTDQEFGFTTRLSHRFGRLVGEISAGVRYLLFDDVSLVGGGREDNTDRNYFEPTAELRLAYEHTPAVRPFAEVRYRPRLHERSVDRSGLRRDSHGGTVAAGVEFDLSQIWTGELALTYDVRTFEDGALDTVHSGGIDANVVWRPSRITTVRWNATSELNESAASGVSAIRSYNGTLEIEHALRDYLSLTASGGLAFNDRIGTARDELVFDAGLGLSYLLSRDAAVLARYGFTKFETFKSNSDYIENQFTAGFRYRL